MFTKKIVLVLCISIFILALFFLYSNILMLDDIHPKSVETLQDLKDDGQGENPENQPSKTESEEKRPIQKKGYHIHINLDEKMMYVYKNAELIKTYPVSGGSRNTPSPLGTWRIISKDTWGEGFGGAWMGFNVPWESLVIRTTYYILNSGFLNL